MTSWNRVEVGDCRAILPTLAEKTFRCCVTSPPYWGLRDYGTASWEGGDLACDHRLWGHASDKPTPGGRGGSMPKQEVVQRTVCRKCGGRRIDAQLGLEPTHDDYVAEMVAVFREVRRVLADDGTLWLNLGDSYARDPAKGGTGTPNGRNTPEMGYTGAKPVPCGLKPKDLVGIPWMVAFALRADGWYLRSDIIWSKPNPMPESVTDRPTKAHEYLFLLSKSPRYYYDADAIRSPLRPKTETTFGSRRRSRGDGSGLVKAANLARDVPVRRPRLDEDGEPSGANARTVWTIASEPYDGAHFATFPRALVTPCILAGSALGDVVLDPFMGSGTVGQVAESLGRRWFGCELNPDYAKQAAVRTIQTGLRF
jgi:site-specific DNA-methyltransferase (cytosine-N4-specific)